MSGSPGTCQSRTQAAGCDAHRGSFTRTAQAGLKTLAMSAQLHTSGALVPTLTSVARVRSEKAVNVET